jgi:hypothetical protein
MSWSHVQGTGVQGAGGISSLSCSFAGALTPADLVVSGVTTYNLAATPPITASDNKGNTWTADTTGTPTNYYLAAISHALATTGGTSFTVTWTIASGGGYPSMAIDEYSYSGTLSVDSAETSGSTTTTTNAPAAGSLAVTGTDLVYAVLGTDASASFTAGSGLALRYNANYANGVAEGICAEDQLGATSAVNPAWSLSAAVACYTAAVAYKTVGAAQDPIGVASDTGSLCMGMP